jgi:hypothetical protein
MACQVSPSVAAQRSLRKLFELDVVETRHENHTFRRKYLTALRSKEPIGRADSRCKCVGAVISFWTGIEINSDGEVSGIAPVPRIKGKSPGIGV